MSDTILINYYRVEKAIRFLLANFRTQPSLERIAKEVHLSPFHFQRIFLDWVGITPKKFLQYLSVDYLKREIADAKSIMAAADLAGFSSQSRVYDLFVNIEGMTPQEYKSHGNGITIHYGYHPSPFGMAFIAISGDSICDLYFLNEERPEDVFNEFAHKWALAKLVYAPARTREYIDAIFETGHLQSLQLFLQGTPFQLKVWEALVNIPVGTVQSYEDIARKINCSEISSVASAAARNPVRYLIPCHRIIYKKRIAGKSHQGSVCKQLMIDWESRGLGPHEPQQDTTCRGLCLHEPQQAKTIYPDNRKTKTKAIA